MVNEYNIEILVVIDPDIKKTEMSPNDKSHEEVVLEKIKQAGELFKNYDIGNNIKLSVSKVIYHHIDAEPFLSSIILKKFCKWQYSKFTEEQHETFDYAMYFTSNIKDGKARSFFGQCARDIKCAVINFKHDIRSSDLREIIAHETGHFLNVKHDDDSECKQYNRNLKINDYIMYPVAEGGILWSPCSKKLLERYLKSENSKCLHNKPKVDLLQNIHGRILGLEGVSRKELCQSIKQKTFDYKEIDQLQDCTKLYCHSGDYIMYIDMKTQQLNGLECGQNKICFDHQCIAKQDVKPINGGWTKWIQEGGCSLKCGGGVTLFKRYCTNPTPKNGGSYCSGESSRFEMCNMEPCRSQRNIRDTSCVTDRKKPCTQYCNSKIRSAIDGTPCSSGYNTGKCLGGYCRPADCKGVLFGNAVADLCGRCQGHNQSCDHYDAYNIPVAVSKNPNTFDSGYFYDIVTIPKGSTNIHIELINDNIQLASIAFRTNDGVYFPDLKAINTLPYGFDRNGYDFEYNMLNKKKHHVVNSVTKYRTTNEDLMIIVLDYNGKGAESISYSWYTQKLAEDFKYMFLHDKWL